MNQDGPNFDNVWENVLPADRTIASPEDPPIPSVIHSHPVHPSPSNSSFGNFDISKETNSFRNSTSETDSMDAKGLSNIHLTIIIVSIAILCFLAVLLFVFKYVLQRRRAQKRRKLMAQRIKRKQSWMSKCENNPTFSTQTKQYGMQFNLPMEFKELPGLKEPGNPLKIDHSHVMALHNRIWHVLQQQVGWMDLSKTVCLLFELGSTLTHPNALSRYVWAREAKTPQDIFKMVFRGCCRPSPYTSNEPIRMSEAFVKCFQAEWRDALQWLIQSAHLPIIQAMNLLHCYVYYLFQAKAFRPHVFWLLDVAKSSLQQLDIDSGPPTWPGLYQLSRKDPRGQICLCPPLNARDEPVPPFSDLT